MAPNKGCSLCGESDLWKHSLIECNVSRCVWSLEREEIVEFLRHVPEVDARAWLSVVMNHLPHEDLTRVVVRLWGDLVHET
jgi:hypothetical protein